MPKKRLNIILILIVLGLWGTVAYKSINRFFSSEQIVMANANSGQNFSFKRIEKDTFQLSKLNRDPFLDKSLVGNTNPLPVKKVSYVKAINKPKSIETPKPSPIWPQVSYYGYIKSHQKTEELILVKIDNKLLKVRKNQSIEGVIIKRIFNDSIEVGFNKEKKFVYINR